MPKVITDSIPVSPFCQYALGANKSTLRFMVVVTLIIIALTWYFFDEWIAALCSVVLGILAWAVIDSLRNDENMWLEINKKDYDVSMQLEDILRTFYHYPDQDIYKAGVAEDKLDSLWKPVYAQYFSGATGLSGDISVSGIMGGLLGTNGTLSGKVVGSVGPESLADLGAVIVMQGENGKSMRVVIPHRQVAEQMFAEALLSFTSDENTLRTLTSLRILRIATLLPTKARTTFTSAMVVLDQIVGSVGKPLEERPLVTVYGKEVGPGIIMATALEVGGERGIFIPTGYIKEVTEKLSGLLGPYRGDVKMLLDGEGPFADTKAQVTV